MQQWVQCRLLVKQCALTPALILVMQSGQLVRLWAGPAVAERQASESWVGPGSTAEVRQLWQQEQQQLLLWLHHAASVPHLPTHDSTVSQARWPNVKISACHATVLAHWLRQCLARFCSWSVGADAAAL